MPDATRPLIIGEVLFDHFPDGHRVLGGAPFNVAWNLQGMGLNPVFVSAVGDDEEGRIIRQRMQSWGLDDSWLQTSETLPTGRVQVNVKDGQPSFEILDRQAYDDIKVPDFTISSADFSLLYMGSLAYRNEPTRSTLQTLIEGSDLPRFVDINIRQPWFDRDWAKKLLGGACWVKLNDDELSWLSESECQTSDMIASAIKKLRRQYGGQYHFITCGAQGAYAMGEAGEMLFAESPTPDPMVDTVGAGDAFAAATILGISRADPVNEILQAAVQFAARACTIQGATTEDRDHYRS